MKPIILFLLTSSLLIFSCSEGHQDLANDTPVEFCVERDLRQEEFNRVFYEIIDLGEKEVWGTNEFTEEEFDEFKIPFWRKTWRKNSPREGFIDSMIFTRSPGCPEDGLFTYKQMFDKDWLKVVNLVEVNQKMEGTDGLLTRFTLEKYHRVWFFAGKEVYILTNPDGEQYISLTRSTQRETDTANLPDGWVLKPYTIKKDMIIDLFGVLDVLRGDNEDSYQGPLASDFDIKEYTQ